MRCRNRWAFPCLLLALTLISVPAQAAEILVFAAASTTDAVDEVGRRFAADDGHEIVASFASSSTLAKQIENGAPVDIYISADTKWMDYLAERGLIASDSRANLLGNSLVLIAPRESDWTFELAADVPLAEALGDSRLAIGDPDHVPAGRYGKAALESLGLWDGVESKLARAKDVRAALALVERGETVAGIVYATDAAASDKVRVVDVFPAGSHPEIVYPVAIVAGRDTTETRAFYQFLAGPTAREVFERYGFTVRSTGAPSN